MSIIHQLIVPLMEACGVNDEARVHKEDTKLKVARHASIVPTNFANANVTCSTCWSQNYNYQSKRGFPMNVCKSGSIHGGNLVHVRGLLSTLILGHNVVHIVDELVVCRAVVCRWVYPIKRYL